MSRPACATSRSAIACSTIAFTGQLRGATPSLQRVTAPKHDRERSRYHRNIRVEGNTFRVFDPRIVNLYCVDGFVFTQDNVIEYTDDYPVLPGEKRNFITRNCDNIVIEKEQTDK